MKRSMFGDPRPLGHAEIVEAIDELGIDLTAARAMVDEPGEDGLGGHGWTAEISGPDEDDEFQEFSTRAYPTKDQLLADIKASGIDDIE